MWWELIACRLHSRWLKAEELCTMCVSVSPFRWPDCRVFVSAACFTVTSTEPVKPNTLSARKDFPETTAWFLYEVQRHPRWACTLGSLLNLTLNMPNKPTPLEISFEKLSLLVFFLFFFEGGGGGCFPKGCPRCNIADVNQYWKEMRRESGTDQTKLTPVHKGGCVYANKVRDWV